MYDSAKAFGSLPPCQHALLLGASTAGTDPAWTLRAGGRGWAAAQHSSLLAGELRSLWTAMVLVLLTQRCIVLAVTPSRREHNSLVRSLLLECYNATMRAALSCCATLQFRQLQVCLDALAEQPPNRFLSEKEERAHFAIWAILKSPLMIAADLRR